MIEMQATVVDSVEATLDAVIVSADARVEVTVVITNRNEESVNAVVDVFRNELSEDNCRLAVQCGVAEVVLPCATKWRVDDPLFCLVVKRCRRRDIRDV